MASRKQDVPQQQVAEFYEKHREPGKAFTVKHFTSMNVPRRTCYRYVSQLETCGGIPQPRQVGSGWKARNLDRYKMNRLVQQAQNKLGVSTRKLARKFEISPVMYERYWRKRVLSTGSENESPALTEKQEKKRKLSGSRNWRVSWCQLPENGTSSWMTNVILHSRMTMPRGIKGSMCQEAPRTCRRKYVFAKKKLISKEDNALARYQPTGRL